MKNILFGIVPFIAGAVIATVLQQAMTTWSLQWSSLFLMLIFFCIALISIMFFLLHQDVDEIRHSVGINVTYLERKTDQANLFKRAREVIQNAQESIYILSSFMKEGSITSNNEPIKERDEYYDALINQVIKNKKKVTYQRILQIQKGQKVSEHVESQEYLKHLHKMLDAKEADADLSIGLLKAPAERVTTFVLIDGVYLLWQINELIDKNTTRIHGIFIIEDPKKEITGTFIELFEHMKLKSTGAVKRNELPPISAT